MRHESQFLTDSGVERLLHYMPACAEQATNPWARTFATDMAKRARWKNWRPSPKQAQVMQLMVNDLFANGESEVIE